MSVGIRPGAGVRLGDEPLLLQRGHVVADGGRGDAEPVPVDERLGADRLLGGDVVLDDRAEHGELAVLDHRLASSAVRSVAAGTRPFRVPRLLPGGLLPACPAASRRPARHRLRRGRATACWVARYESGSTSTSASSAANGGPAGRGHPRLGAGGAASWPTSCAGSARRRRRGGQHPRALRPHLRQRRLHRGVRRAAGDRPRAAAAARAATAAERSRTLATDRHGDDPRPRTSPAARIVLPTETFSSARVVDLGDRLVELVHPGRGHTAGDLVVRVRRRRRGARRRPGRGVRAALGGAGLRRRLLPDGVAGHPGPGDRPAHPGQRGRARARAAGRQGLRARSSARRSAWWPRRSATSPSRGVPVRDALAAAEWPYPRRGSSRTPCGAATSSCRGRPSRCRSSDRRDRAAGDAAVGGAQCRPTGRADHATHEQQEHGRCVSTTSATTHQQHRHQRAPDHQPGRSHPARRAAGPRGRGLRPGQVGEQRPERRLRPRRPGPRRRARRTPPWSAGRRRSARRAR